MGASTAGRSPGADDGRPERQKMILYIDDGYIIGWYYSTDGGYIGDGTLETAERIERERQE